MAVLQSDVRIVSSNPLRPALVLCAANYRAPSTFTPLSSICLRISTGATNIFISGIIFQSNSTQSITQGLVALEDSSVTLLEVTFSSFVGIDGGAVAANSARLLLARCLFSNNLAFRGSALFAVLRSVVTVLETVSEGNSARDRGGAMYLECLSAFVSASTFSRNEANNGGALCLRESLGAFLRSTLHLCSQHGCSFWWCHPLCFL